MADGLEMAEGTWEGVFRYRNSDGKWRFACPGHWRFYKDRTGVTERHTKLVAIAKSVEATCNLPADELQSLLKWFAEQKDHPDSNPVAPGPVSVLLSNMLISERIASFKILNSIVGEHMTTQMIALPDRHPCWFYQKLDSKHDLLEDYILALPELFADWGLADLSWKYSEDKTKATVSDLEYHRILHECTILEYTNARLNDPTPGITIRIRDKERVVRYRKARLCQCIPIPGKNRKLGVEPPLGVKTPEVIIASPVVRRTLEKLGQIWQDRFAKSVLISAPPGSGKENFAASIPYGNGRIKEGDLPTLALSAGQKGDLERQLFGERDPTGSLHHGLIRASSGKALFMDEVHHPEDEAGIRASLLRTLESDDYTPVGSTQIEKVQDVLFILATSRRLKRADAGSSGKPLAEIPPVDFWTRMTYVIEIDHPLDYNESEAATTPTHKSVLESFFIFFWWQRVEDFYGLAAETKRDDLSTTGDALKLDHLNILLDENLLKTMASEFEKVLRAKLDATNNQRKRAGQTAVKVSDLSVRGIRTMVTRLVSDAASRVARGESFYEPADFPTKLGHVIEEILDVALLTNADSKPTQSKGWHFKVQLLRT